MKDKIFRNYFHPGNLQKEINRYGYRFSLAAFWKLLIIESISVIFVAWQFGLSMPYILLIFLLGAVCTPIVILSVYRNLYEQKRFVDITNYLEQILYSFKRRTKILDSLEDTLELFHEGKMHQAIARSIAHIRNSPVGDYNTAFSYIEKEYGCERMKTIHQFLIKVEAVGGRYDASVELLLDDRDMWVRRTYELQSEKKNLKNKIAISVILSLLVCGITLTMLPKEMQITHTTPSRLATTMVFITNILIFVFAQVKLTGSWTQKQEENEKTIHKNYRKVEEYKEKQEKRKGYLQGACMLPFLVIGIVLKNYWLAGLGAAAAYFMVTAPKRNYRLALKQTKREIEKQFPSWLMELALLLQTDNVIVAMAKTIHTVPIVMKSEIEMLIHDIEEEPGSVIPYAQFMKRYELTEVRSAMRILFSMSEYGQEHSQKQIGTLIQRNAQMMDKAERIRSEDQIAGMSMLFLLPMVTGTLKMLVDLAMLLVSLTKMI